MEVAARARARAVDAVDAVGAALELAAHRAYAAVPLPSSGGGPHKRARPALARARAVVGPHRAGRGRPAPAARAPGRATLASPAAAPCSCSAAAAAGRPAAPRARVRVGGSPVGARRATLGPRQAAIGARSAAGRALLPWLRLVGRVYVDLVCSWMCVGAAPGAGARLQGAHKCSRGSRAAHGLRLRCATSRDSHTHARTRGALHTRAITAPPRAAHTTAAACAPPPLEPRETAPRGAPPPARRRAALASARLGWPLRTAHTELRGVGVGVSSGRRRPARASDM